MADNQRRLRQRSAAVALAVTAIARDRGRFVLLLSLVALTLAVAARQTPAQQPVAPPADLSDYPFLMQRAPDAPGAEDALATLLVVGDVMPGRAVATQEDPLRHVAPWLGDADLTLGNLEAVLDPQGAPRDGGGDNARIVLSAPANASSWLSNAGFDLLGLANNHSLDFGAAGLARTVSLLTSAAITPLGAGRGADAYFPHIRTIHGVRLAFLAFNAVPDPQPLLPSAFWQHAQWDQDRAIAAVESARQRTDAVVVFLHWGDEYSLRAAPWQRDAARALAQAGADLIVGHHPHVVQEWTLLPSPSPQRQVLVAYSLGNLLFDQQVEHTAQGLALRASFDRQGLVSVQALPLWAGPQPRLMTPRDARPLLARIAPAPARQAWACHDAGCDPADSAITSGEAGEAIFWSGSIDLTGDGQPEQVRRAADRVHIYRDGVQVWVSPPQWRVVDVALGDPNDDGRGELLLALWQTDANGDWRSQPFIVGYREGQYKVIWGGRPVTAPILEVALGDLTGDGRHDLAVVEQDGDEKRLAVWLWQGWNFSLHWQSEPGAYSDLRLVPQSDAPPYITVALEASDP